MDETNASNFQRDTFDDEISIAELLAKLWRKRGLIVALPLVALGLAITAVIGTKIASGDQLSYHIDLTAIDDGAYPNGAAFSPQDLLNPEVLQRLSDVFALHDPEELPSHIRVQYGSPVSEALVVQFKAALATNSKAKPEDLDKISARYKSEIRQAARRGLKITVDPAGLGLTKSQGKQLALMLPNEWARVYTERFRVFSGAGINGLSVISQTPALTSAVGIREASEHLRAMRAGSAAIANNRRFRAVRSDEGMTANDLLMATEEFNRIYFSPLYQSNYSKESSLARVYQREVLLQQAEISMQLTELDERISAIQSAHDVASGVQSDSRGAMGQSNAISQLVNLSQQASQAEYLQESFNRRSALVREHASLSTRLQKMGYEDVSSQSLLTEGFVSDAQTIYDRLQRNYASLLRTAQSIAASETPLMFRHATGVSSSSRLLEKRDILIMVLATVLAGMIAVVAALLWPEKPSTL